MNKSVPIQYMGFWDVPLVFIARQCGKTFFFECVFDQELDDYPDVYKVYILPNLTEGELPNDWTTLSSRAIQSLGEVPVQRVHFDSTKRHSIDPAILDELITRQVVAG